MRVTRGSTVELAALAGPDRVSPLALSPVQRLEMRSMLGNEEPAQDLFAAVRQEPPPGES